MPSQNKRQDLKSDGWRIKEKGGKAVESGPNLGASWDEMSLKETKQAKENDFLVISGMETWPLIGSRLQKNLPFVCLHYLLHFLHLLSSTPGADAGCWPHRRRWRWLGCPGTGRKVIRMASLFSPVFTCLHRGICWFWVQIISGELHNLLKWTRVFFVLFFTSYPPITSCLVMLTFKGPQRMNFFPHMHQFEEMYESHLQSLALWQQLITTSRERAHRWGIVWFILK